MAGSTGGGEIIMATREIAAHEIHAHGAPQGFIRKWVFSLDHKVIGLQYYFLALTAVFVGMFLSLLMRIHLIWPAVSLPLFGEIKPEAYLSLLTMHGTIMVFFVLTTAPQGGFGNYFLPIQIGAADMAFPVLNMLSFWVTALAFVVMLGAFFVTGGAPLHGWTGYPPLSAVQSAGPGEGAGADLWIISIALFCIGALMSALNFITTTLDMRTKGMSMMRMPLTCWAWFITAILGLLAFGVLFSAGILLLLDRNAGTSFYVPLTVFSGQVVAHKGGSPLLWQHLFCFFGHDDGDWSAFRDQDFQLVGDVVGRPNSIGVADVVCHRICFLVRVWRYQRTVPGATDAGYPVARYRFCDRTFPLNHGGGFDFRDFCGYLLLVPQNVWTHDERESWTVAFLVDVRGNVLRLHADALCRHGGSATAVLTIHQAALFGEADPAEYVHHFCCVRHHQRAAHLRLQSVLEYEGRQKSQRQSLGSDHAGVDNRDAASAR